MKKRLLNVFMATTALLSAHVTTAQCTATIYATDSCAPTVLHLNAGFALGGIQWSNGGTVIQTATGTWNPYGVIVAGGNGQGSAANQLNQPMSIAVDTAGAVYLADPSNYRIQKWAPGATTGVTVAGGNGSGSAANQVNFPTGVFVDSALNVYIVETFSARVSKWAPGATAGVVVAGGNGSGSAANQLSFPGGLFVKNGDIYVMDAGNSRVQKWTPGATTGITVAGGNGMGSAANQIGNPSLNGSLFVDAANNIYIAEYSNQRVSKWTPGATAGITVAGGNGSGSAANQLSAPNGIWVNAAGTIFISEYNNNRISIWPAGATSGTTLTGNGSGSALNQLQPAGVVVTANNTVYAADYGNHRALKYAFVVADTLAVTTPGTYTAVATGGACSTTVSYTVHGPIVAQITPAGPASICQGDTLTLQGNTGTGYIYSWQFNGTTTSIDTVSTQKAAVTGSYSVVVSYAGGACAGTSPAVQVTTVPLPVPVITNNNNVLNTTSFATYQWYLNGVAITGATSATYTALANGSYTVAVTDGSSCTGISTAVNVTSVSVSNLSLHPEAVSIYPNPARGTLYISTPEKLDVHITSMEGRSVIKASNTDKIDISKLAAGLYLVHIYDAKGNFVTTKKLSVAAN